MSFLFHSKHDHSSFCVMAYDGNTKGLREACERRLSTLNLKSLALVDRL